jgi:hypothetical protein
VQLQTLFAIFSLRTTMRGFLLSSLPSTFYCLLLADARHQSRQSSSCGYLVPRQHSSQLPQHLVLSYMNKLCKRFRLRVCGAHGFDWLIFSN